MRSLRKLPIQKQFGLVTYVPAIFLFVVLTINAYALRQSDLERHAQQYTALLSTVFRQILIRKTDESQRLINVKQLSDQVLKHNPDILSLEILNAFGQGITTKQPGLDDFSGNKFHYLSVTDTNNLNVGAIKVALDDHSAQRELLSNMLVAVVAALLCVFFTRKTTSCAIRRITRVHEALDKIESGTTSARIHYPHNNDFGRFSTRFNHVLEKLDKSIVERDRIYNELLISKNAADRVVAEKTEFIARFCAAFRIPLNHLISDIKAATSLPANEHRATLVKSLSGLRTLHQFTDDLQNFSNIEFGEIELKTGPILLSDCVEQAITCYAPDHKNRQVTVETVFSGDAWTTEVIGDPIRIAQIIHCLMTKAVHHAERGKIYVRANAIVIGDQRTSVTIDVTDSGRGLESFQVEEMNEAFQQSEKEYRTYAPERPCLGIALADRLSLLMDGQLSVRSKIGVGTTYSCDLLFKHSSDVPALHADLLPSLTSIKAVIHHCSEVPLFKDILSIKSIDANFIDSEFDVEVVRRSNIAIVDLTRNEGVNFTYQLRQSFPLMPVIAIIGQDQTKAEIDFYGFDISAVIEKPVKRFEVMQAIRNHFVVANKISAVLHEGIY